MPTYYVDSAGSNTAPYDTWAKAAPDPQTVVDIAAAGDIINARGTHERASAAGPLILKSSGAVNNVITFQGYAADGVTEGQYVINGKGGDLPADVMQLAGFDYWEFRHVSFDGATNAAVNADTATSLDVNFYHCLFTNAAYGIDCNATENLRRVLFEQCQFVSNSTDGIFHSYNSMFKDCLFASNTGYGCYHDVGGGNFNGCVFRENGDDQLRIAAGAYYSIVNCVFDASTAGSGIWINNSCSGVWMLNNAFTNNNQYGIEVDTAADSSNKEDYNGFLNNGVADRALCDTGPNSWTFAADPYVGAAADNYSTADTATGRRTAILIDW